MVAEPILPRFSKMPPKKGHVGQKRMKAGTKNAMFRANKAASDAAVADGMLNPTPVGRPPLMQGAEVVLSPPVGLPRGSERRGAAIAAGEVTHAIT